MKQTTAGSRRPFDTWDGSKLASWRRAREWTVLEAATFFGVSPATYYRWENGHPPCLDTANKIVKATNGGIRYRDMWPGFNPEFA